MYFPRTNDDKPIGRLVKNNFTADYYTKRPAISLFYREIIIQKEVFKYQKRKHNIILRCDAWQWSIWG